MVLVSAGSSLSSNKALLLYIALRTEKRRPEAAFQIVHAALKLTQSFSFVRKKGFPARRPHHRQIGLREWSGPALLPPAS